MATIRNPIEWTADVFKFGARHVGSMGHSLAGTRTDGRVELPEVRRIGIPDLKDVVARGVQDFGACRTDVIFLCLIYPIVGLVLIQFAFNADILHLVLPLASGFALIGPVVAVGLYELSRRREQGRSVTWGDALGVFSSPSLGAILVLGLLLAAILFAWLAAAQGIYDATLGPAPPVAFGPFLRDVFTTEAGWAMIVVGVGVGFLFALGVLAITVVSFPLLLDRDVGVLVAMVTSIRVSLANPVPVAIWGLIIAAGLVVGSIPVFLGLIVILPVLGHATWHMYRKTVAREDEPGPA